MSFIYYIQNKCIYQNEYRKTQVRNYIYFFKIIYIVLGFSIYRRPTSMLGCLEIENNLHNVLCYGGNMKSWAF